MTSRISTRKLAPSVGSLSSYQFDPDTLHKILKKQAQLTKVIAVLNKQNEDHSYEAQQLQKTLEESTRKSTEAWNAEREHMIYLHMTHLQQTQAEASKNQEEAIEASKAANQILINTHAKDVETLKTNLAAEHANAITALEERSMNECEQVEAKFDMIMQSIKSQHAAEAMQMTEDNHKLIEQHQAEIVQHKKNNTELVEKHLLQQKLDAEKYTASLLESQNQWQTEKQGFVDQIAQDKKKHAEDLYATKFLFGNNIDNERGDFRKNREAFLHEKRQLEQEIAGLKNDVFTVRSELTVRTNEVASHQVALESLKDQNSGSQKRLMESLAEIEALNVIRHKVREALDTEILKVAAIEKSLEASTARSETLNAELAASRSEISALIASHKKTGEANEQAMKEIRLKSAATQNELEVARSESMGLRNKRTELNEQIRHLEQENANKIAMYEQSLQDLRNEHTLAIGALQATIATKGAEIQRIEEEKHHVEALAGDETSEYRSKIEQLQAQLQVKNGQLDSKNLELRTAHTEYAKRGVEIENLQNEIKALQKDNEASLDRLNEAARSEVEQLKSKIHKQAARAEEDIRRQLNADHLSEIDALTTKMTKEGLAEREELITAHVKERFELQSSFDSKLRSTEKALAQLETKLYDMQQEHEHAVAVAENAYHEATRKLNEEQSQQITELQMKTEQTLSQTTQSLMTEHENQMRTLRGEHAKVLEVMRSQFEQSTLETKLQMEAHIEAINEEWDAKMFKQIEEVKDSCEDRIRTKEEHEEELNQNILQLKDDISQQMMQVQLKDMTVAEKTEMLKSLEGQLTLKNMELKQMEEQRTAEVNRLQKFNEVTAKHLKQELTEEHLFELKGMIGEFQAAETYMKKEQSEMAAKLAEADIRYAKRPSREDDLDRIKALEEEVRRRNRKLLSMQEEIEFYKLELSNREDNLNKLFGAKPYVGVMKPLEQKKSKTGSSVSRLPAIGLNGYRDSGERPKSRPKSDDTSPTRRASVLLGGS